MTRINKIFNPKEYKKKSERLFDYLNNEEGNKPKLTPEELEVANWAKSLFDKYADKLDESLARQGLPPINRRKNYITNLINVDIKEALRNNRILKKNWLLMLFCQEFNLT
jgi:hypothetical protein